MTTSVTLDENALLAIAIELQALTAWSGVLLPCRLSDIQVNAHAEILKCAQAIAREILAHTPKQTQSLDSEDE